MIPDLPKSVTDSDALAFYSDLLSSLEDQSTIHTNWHIHKNNPAVCWICDIPICARKIAYLVEQYLSKSTLDTDDNAESGFDSEPESDIENLTDLEIEQGYNEPEYDTVDDDLSSHVEEEV